MSNLSYCRFQNTAEDLKDCLENISEKVSEEEHKARGRLIRIAKEIAEYDNEDLPFEEDED